jgi:protein-S-isoprenylcysteine O-methyltransferase Ste14
MFLYLYLVSALLLLVTAFVVFRILVRRDYRLKGRPTPFTIFLELVVWGMIVCFPSIYNPQDWWLFWFADAPVHPIIRFLGIIITTTGIAVMVVSMISLGFGTTFGQKHASLRRSGLYRFSRNPQIVGFWLMAAGVVLLWPSWHAVGWLLIIAIISHMMVMTEEEHLLRQLGGEYEQYCEQVPRYFRVRRKAREGLKKD